MTDTNTDPAAAPAADPNTPTPAPAADPNTPTPAPAADPNTPSFAIPEAFKDKPWTQKVKSTDDLFKMYDEVQPLLGKKHAVPDHKTADTETLEGYYKALAPETAEGYEIPDVADKQDIQNLFFEAKLSPYQAELLQKAHAKQAAEKAEAARDKDAYVALMKERFGDKYEEKVSGIASTLKSILPPEKQEIVEALANEELAFVFDVVDSLLTKFGASESSAAIATKNAPAGSAAGDLEAQKNAVRNELIALQSKPHTVEEKAALQNKLKELINRG